MPEIKSVAVFCGAQPGHDPACREAATELGAGLAHAGMRLVYGGGRVGLMGAVADAALAGGGEVVGIIPAFLTRMEIAHDGVAEMVVTDGMHDRKRRMFAMADAFVTLPGGLGTLDETIEIVTWKQLRLHDKPILLCDVAGSASGFLSAIDHAIDGGFAQPEVRCLFEVVDGVVAVLARLQTLARSTATDTARL